MNVARIIFGIIFLLGAMANITLTIVNGPESYHSFADNTFWPWYFDAWQTVIDARRHQSRISLQYYQRYQCVFASDPPYTASLKAWQAKYIQRHVGVRFRAKIGQIPDDLHAIQNHPGCEYGRRPARSHCPSVIAYLDCVGEVVH